MGFLDKVAKLRDKANRLGIDTDVDQRRQDRHAEARGRLDAGRQTLTAIMDGQTEQLRSRVSAAAGQSEAVGKITQVMAEVAPVLQQHPAELQQVVRQIDAAKAELGGHEQLPQAAGRVEAAMGTLLQRANLPADVMPRNLLADLVTDAVDDHTPRTEPNPEVAAQEATGSAPARPSRSSSTSASPNAPTASPAKQRKRRRRDADAARPTGTGRRDLRDLARGSGFLDSFRAPASLAGLVSNPAAAVSSLTSAPAGMVDRAVSAVSAAPGAAANTALSSVQSAVGGLGALGGSIAPGATSSTARPVDRAVPATGGAEPAKKGQGAGKALGILGGALSAFGVDTGPVTIDSDGVTVTAGGDSANASLTVGPDGGVSVAGELSKETPLGTVSVSAEHELGAEGGTTLSGSLSHETPLGDVSLEAERDDEGGGSVSIDTPAGTIPIVGGEDAGGGGFGDVLGGVFGGIFGGGSADAAPPAPPPIAASAPAHAPASTSDTDASEAFDAAAHEDDSSAPDEAAPAPIAPPVAAAPAPAPAHAAPAHPVAPPAAVPMHAVYTPPAAPATLLHTAAYVPPAAPVPTPRPRPASTGGSAPAAPRSGGGGRRFDTARAVRTAQSDNARSGYCAKGVANVLQAQGFPVTRGNATNWWRTLPQLGWHKVEGATPTSAPEGAVLVYTNNAQAGKRVTRRRGGQLYGHVEIVGISNGRRVYISDAVRSNWGGTVPTNFKGAYVFGTPEPAVETPTTMLAGTQPAPAAPPVIAMAQPRAPAASTGDTELGDAPAGGEASVASNHRAAPAGGGQSGQSGRRFDTARGIRTAQSDSARSGYCAKGVANVLTAQGFPVTRGNATNWWRTLPQLGWHKVEGATPTTAPEGAVLVFTNNAQAGKRVTRRKGGQLYGHVEIVGITNGRRVYISDAVRNNWGGTVPTNFKGAYTFGSAEVAVETPPAMLAGAAPGAASGAAPAAPRSPGATPAAAPASARAAAPSAIPASAPAAPRAGGQVASADTQRMDDAGSLRATLASLQGGGQALPGGIAADFGQRLNADLSGVRVHTSGPASVAAADMGARAFTAGEHIVFAPGRGDLASNDGMHVLAHELVHVVQNQRGPAMELAARLEVGPSNSPIESEAEAGASAITSGASFSVASHSSVPGISRFNDGDSVPAAPPAPVPVPAPTPARTSDATPAATPAAPPTPAATPGPAPSPAPTPGPTGPTPAPAGARPSRTPAPAPSRSVAPAAPRGAAPAAPRAPQPQPAPAPRGDLDARVRETLNQRADPTSRAQYTRSINQINMLRAQSLQYSFTNSGFGHTLFQSLVFPTDALGDHIGQIHSANAYRGDNDGTFSLANLQVWIERTRGVLHIFGDLAGIVASWAGVAALVSGALALITSETIIGGLGFGAIAVAAEQVAVIATCVKLVLDILDMILGIVQMIITVKRIRASSDPVARARLATLLKKESGELASNLTNIVIQAVVLVGTAGTGAAFARTAERGFMRTFASEIASAFKPLTNVARLGLRQGMRETLGVFAVETAGRGVATNGRRVLAAEAEAGVVRLNVLKRAANGRVTSDREVIAFTTRNQMRGARLEQNARAVGKIVATNGLGTLAAGGVALAQVTTKAPSRDGARPAGTSGPNVPASPGGSLTTVQMWPEQIESFEAAKAPLAAARERMQEQYDNARGQLDENRGSNADAQLRQALQIQHQQADAANTVRTDAAAGRTNAQHGATTATQGRQQQQRQTAASTQLGGAQDRLSSQGHQLRPPEPAQSRNWLQRAYDATIGWVLERIGAAISSVQNWITRTVMQIAIGQSGLTREELDMAGIENEMRTDATREDESTAAANATAQQGQPVQQKVYELQQNLTRDEQNAVQGMADALQYIDALTEAERVLTEAMTNGNTYIDRVSPILRHELDVQSGGRAIDAAYVAPVSGYADSFISSLGNDGTAERARGQANTQFAQARAEFPGLDTSTFSANVGRLCGSYDTEYQRLAGSARTQAQQVKTVIQTYVGTSDYEGVNANAEALDQLATSFTSAVSRLTDALYAGINAVINDLMRQLAAASSSETPAAPAPPPDAPSTTASPAPAAEAPPAPAAE